MHASRAIADSFPGRGFRPRATPRACDVLTAMANARRGTSAPFTCPSFKMHPGRSPRPVRHWPQCTSYTLSLRHRSGSLGRGAQLEHRRWLLAAGPRRLARIWEAIDVIQSRSSRHRQGSSTAGINSLWTCPAVTMPRPRRRSTSPPPADHGRSGRQSSRGTHHPGARR